MGRELARAGAIVVNGGGGGVMAAASRGADAAGGLVVGILPGSDRSDANQWVGVALPTGLGELRNGLIVRAADVVLAVGGAYGTLSEIALALATGVPVVGSIRGRSRASRRWTPRGGGAPRARTRPRARRRPGG